MKLICSVIRHIININTFVSGNLVHSLDAPVFINQDIGAQIATPIVKNDHLVTQTVYGFLDFTTTIGNTVMIFSPQSTSPPTEKPKDVATNNIIDTKPRAVQDPVSNIKPSKTQQVTKKTETSAVVQVNAAPKLSSKVEVKSSPVTKVNVIGNKSSQKPKQPPIIISKVEVIGETKPTVSQNVITKVEVVTEKPKSVVASKVEVVTEAKPTQVHSIVHVKSDDEPAVIIGNNIGEPEYDFLSRQPSEVVEETYKVINLKPSSKFHLKPRSSSDGKNKATKRPDNAHPTGLVSRMEGMVVHDGIMTSYETSVIGTYISGKYAQVLQSTSHVFNSPKDHGRQKITPTQSLRILKTAAPSLKGNKKSQHLEPTPAAAIHGDVSVAASDAFKGQNSIKTTRKPGKRTKNRPKENGTPDQRADKEPTGQGNSKKSSKNRTSSRNSKQHTSSQRQSKSGRGNRKSSKSSKTTTPTSAHSEESTPAPGSSGKRYNGNRRKTNRPSTNSPSVSSEDKNNNAGFSRRGYKPKVQTSNVEPNSASTTLYKFKLNRSPGRWQYKTTAKPRVTIRKQNDEDGTNNNEALESNLAGKPEAGRGNNDPATTRSDESDSLEGSESITSIIDDESATENKLDGPSLPLETIKVEISTPPDFKDVYYEIATIKSPYTFQVGSIKNTRYVTVTSTFEKSLENAEPTPTLAPTEPLTENILATSSNYAKDNNLDSSIATLPPIYLASDVATPPLETLTETFSTTQTMLKTHILPVIRSINDTTSSTLVQTYLITRLVTATKTLPPMDAYHFNPSKTLNEFNSRLDEAGSELHLELEFGDSNEQDEDGVPRRTLPADLDLANVGTDFKLPETDKAKIEKELKQRKQPKQPSFNEFQFPQQSFSPDQLQQLALLRFLNPAAAQGQIITTSRPVLKVETLYETHVLPVTQGHNTILSTISKIKGTYTKTDFEYGTSTIPPAFPPQPIPQIPQIPQFPQLNPLLPQPPINQQPQFTVTSSPVTQNTIITQTNSKVLKLTFGARTALTTVFSTTVIPTVLTTYMTASVPVVAPTAAFPGYFPAPYPAYPYVG
ncbi:hypothetical protein GWI33_017941 [Rhynchophorus ferrugineus]|uniref:DUF4758 domain-containing protein n=1 Tax=Rhynchophorus ferrugineus TaxID=354439 RepID=A0A834HVS4_RHYFE|nr:hypothetical protein GWI33_017941 [Rhynchophorus ferrugineus]